MTTTVKQVDARWWLPDNGEAQLEVVLADETGAYAGRLTRRQTWELLHRLGQAFKQWPTSDQPAEPEPEMEHTHVGVALFALWVTVLAAVGVLSIALLPLFLSSGHPIAQWWAAGAITFNLSAAYFALRSGGWGGWGEESRP